MLAMPDWDTVRIASWLPKTAIIMCDLLDVANNTFVDVAPRSILRAQVDQAAALGFMPMLGSEIEFFLYHDSYDEAKEKNYRELRTHSVWAEDYNILQTTRDEYIVGAIRSALENSGVPIEFSKGEAGAGQHEINLSYSTAVEMADRNHIYKNAAKEIAAANGRSITFMAKPDFNDVGSSCHIHASLWTLDGSKSVFEDHSNALGMSETFRHFLAGQIHTAREFSLLWAPTVNSYRRFQPGSWAPTGIGWGVDNRTLGFRKVGHGSGTRIENRIPGADANSYLAFAGTIAGGLYGIKNKLSLGEPFAGNGYEDANVGRVPWNLPDAIELWRNSAIARECFGDNVHHWILRSAESEWEAFNRTVTDWEKNRYFERI
jgi:glutamine synthetase